MHKKEHSRGPWRSPSRASSLAACGGNDAKLPKPKAATGVAYPAMSTERFGKVQKKVFTAISQADGSLNADALTARVTGPMKTIRSAQYKLKGILNDGYTLTELSTLTSRQGIAVSGDGSFPRLGFSVMEPVKGTTLPSFDVFLQSTARNNWALWGSLYVEAGATLPSVKVGKSGLELIGAEANEGLAAGPAQTVAAYVQLNNTRSDAKGLTFANDKLRHPAGRLRTTRTPSRSAHRARCPRSSAATPRRSTPCGPRTAGPSWSARWATTSSTA